MDKTGMCDSPLLFNLYSKFKIKEAMGGGEVAFIEINITELRYADDAVLVADRRRKMQKKTDRLSET